MKSKKETRVKEFISWFFDFGKKPQDQMIYLAMCFVASLIAYLGFIFIYLDLFETFFEAWVTLCFEMLFMFIAAYVVIEKLKGFVYISGLLTLCGLVLALVTRNVSFINLGISFFFGISGMLIILGILIKLKIIKPKKKVKSNA